MSRAPLHALIWSKEQRFYELYAQGQFEQRFQPAEEAAWLTWLHGVSSFAFHGARGSLNVYQEQRPRGERIGMPTRPKRAAPASAISDGRRPSGSRG
ncbi:hypothetical protein [Ktedonobacter robiniae]|uniref:Uncharacterized protein n=1 Tax=Ktedonobacter robiniae TaxID=2778365 RepID=A0ABQ3V7H5_9CHLR|nr:hypothetical protein [Ktedonobacter robiniae]GHO60892.1 hypothetical protein KSB_93670 [Ktedonobacter robiniae]